MPKKRLTTCGLELPVNLYPSSRNQANVWRYRLSDGTFKKIVGSARKAISIAKEANRIREKSTRTPYGFHWFKEYYIKSREENDVFLKEKVSWKNRIGMLNSFCDEFEELRPRDVRKVKQFKLWWDALTYDQQHNRRSELSRFFQYMITEEALTINPFTTADDKPKLNIKGKPQKARMPMTIRDFWKIYKAAGELGFDAVQLFMGYALVTDLRESDILKLRFDEHVNNDRLELTIGKSLQQRGAIQASHHCWTFDKHPIVKQLVERSKQLSVKHAGCPYLISHRPKVRKKSDVKEHKYQLLPRLLIKMFSEARDESGVYKNLPSNRTPATIHEIKGLSLHIAKEAGEDITDLQQLAAHTNIRVTQAYMAEHKPSYKEVSVVFTGDMIKGDLRE